VKKNPPWVDEILSENWDELEHVLPASLLPQAQITISLARGQRRRQSRLTIPREADYGCGHFGCVMATNSPGIVCKITTDESEALFVERAWAIFGRPPHDRWPAGIVHYYKIVGLEAADTGRQTWLLWRDEAWDVGQPSFNTDALEGYRYLAKAIRADVLEAGGLSTELKSRIVPQVKEAIDLIKASKHLHAIGEALEAFLTHEMILADVHSGNIGRNQKEQWVITDPGHFVLLSDRGRVRARGTRAP
jgi:hypothetical protein